MAGKPSKRSGTRARSEQTRAAILRAAMEEFAQEGVAGARTDHIARAAGVNKALLYYYFRDKETLYGAAIDQVFSGLKERLLPVLDSALPPREKLLAYAGTHFDYVAQSNTVPRMVAREMMRAGRGGSPHLRNIVERYLRPIHGRLRHMLTAGIESGDFRPFDVDQFIVSMVGLIVFYFMSSPMLRELSGNDPLAPARIAARKQAVLEMIAAASAPAARAQRSKMRGKA